MRSRAVVMAPTLVALAVLLVLGRGDAVATGRVVSAPMAPSPGASPASADCSDLAAVVSGGLDDGAGLEATPTTGIEAIDPDDLLDPFLSSLGLGRTDVCGVMLRYGPEPATGMLLWIRDAGPGLGPSLATALADRLRGYGQAVAEETLAVSGAPVTRLRIASTGGDSLLLVASFGSGPVLLTGSPALVEVVRAILLGAPFVSPPASPEPSPSTHGPSDG